MISPRAFYETLAAEGVNFVVGVPDSLLKELCTYIDAAVLGERHVISANEGTAVGLAAGHHLAKGGIPLIYLQNSGLGNMVNPLLSLADAEVYSLPMIAIVGWRGEPGLKDEPQHVKQGRVTTSMLDAMEIPYRVLNGDQNDATDAAIWACRTAQIINAPVMLLVQKGAFGKAEEKRPICYVPEKSITRESAIELIISNLPASTMVVATTGMISRELYELRGALGQDRSSDFLTVGSMGHASQIALGIARAKPETQVVCLDGDGAALMHLGGMATIGTSVIGNLLHIVLNNGAHDSVGGQPTVAQKISLTAIARACGYDVVVGPSEHKKEIVKQINNLAKTSGRRFLEVRVRPGSRSDLGRPQENPIENKLQFIGRLRS